MYITKTNMGTPSEFSLPHNTLLLMQPSPEALSSVAPPFYGSPRRLLINHDPERR